MLTHTQMIVRIGVGAALGGIIGYERDVHRRPVGLRTHLIVAMTAATFMLISSQFVFWQDYVPEEHVEVDVSRIAASVVSGIGFLAGGAILRTGVTVQGLTTAAGLWLVTAIGMCSGAGMFVEAGVVTALGIFALTVLRRFEDKNVRRRRVAIVLGSDASGVDLVLAAIRGIGAVADEVDYERHFEGESQKIAVTVDVHVPEAVAISRLIDALERIPSVHRVHVQAG